MQELGITINQKQACKTGNEYIQLLCEEGVLCV